MNQYFPNNQQMMLQNHSQVEGPFKACDRPVDFYGVEYKNFINMISNSIVTNCSEITLANNTHDYLKKKKSTETLLSFQLPNLCQGRYSSYASTKATHSNSLNAEADMKVKMFSIKQDIKEICKNKKECHFSL